MMKKRLFAAILAASLSAAALASCGGSGSSSSTNNPNASGSGSSTASTESGTSDSEEPYTITMAYIGASDQPDYQEVMDAINELTMNELNMKFDGIQMSYGDYQDRQRLMLTGGEKLDLLVVFTGNCVSYVSQNLLINLQDYNGVDLLGEYGKDIISEIGEDMAYGAKIGNVLYGIPSQKESNSQAGIVMRKDIVDELGIDPSGWSTREDLDDAFAAVHEAHPELNVLIGTNFISQFQQIDSLGDNFGVLMCRNGEWSMTVENYYETDEYMQAAKKAHEWYSNGYVMLDAATTTETSANLMKAGNAFAFFEPIKPGYLAQEESLTGRELVTQNLYDGVIATLNVNYMNWGIAHQSEDPVKAMQFLNFCYTNGEFEDLINFGIEGKHWAPVDGSETIIDYPEGVTADTCGYHLAIGWLLPNQFKGHVWNGNPENVWEQYKEFNAAANWSKAYGFIMDASTVLNEQTALTNVLNTYNKSLECGAVDPETTLAKMNEELYAAGLEKYMAEKQRQLDEWAKANGVE